MMTYLPTRHEIATMTQGEIEDYMDRNRQDTLVMVEQVRECGASKGDHHEDTMRWKASLRRRNELQGTLREALEARRAGRSWGF